ncbi:MAG TPA: pyrimidine 5'-nucleotidase [Anaerolineales bacterium]
MNISTIFFDVDDTLYPATSGLWTLIKDRIGLFMSERLKIPKAEVQPLRRKLFEEYGTTLRGLQVNYSFDVADFLAYVHDVPLADYIQPDPVLKMVLKSLPARKFIFTNADEKHARRVLRVLQVEDCFDGIIDVVALDPFCKPMPQSFKIALDLAGEPDPQKCAIIDDISRTTQAAREQGLYAILYGPGQSPGVADAVLGVWTDLPEILNGSKNAS